MAAKKQTPTEAMRALRSGIESELSDLRGRIADAQDRLAELDEAPVPRSEYLERIGGWIDGKARTFAESAEYQVSALRGPAPRFDDVLLGSMPVRGSGGPDVAVADAAPLLCWLMGDEIKAKLAETINAAGFEAGPPSADRPKLRRDLEAELRKLELAEERMIEEASEAGIDIPRRHDADPAVILALPMEAEA